MAPIDDVAEKIGDILLNESVKGGAFVTGIIPPAASGMASAAAHTIERLRAQIKHDKDLRRLMGLEGEVSEEEMNEAIRKLGYVSSTAHVSDSDAKELAELLEERKVLFARLDKTDDNCKLFVFLSRDAEKVKDCLHVMEARRGMVSELNPQLFFNSMKPDKVREISGLDRVELELFRHFAWKDGLIFTSMPTQDGKFSIYHEAADKWKSKADLIMSKLSWMLTGPRCEQVRQQLENRIEGRSKIQDAIDDPQKEMYIVSALNPASFIHITENECTQYKNGKKVNSIARKHEDFPERCMAYCDGLERPVVLAPDDFRSDLTVTDMSRYPTTDFLSHGYDENQEMEKLNDLITLVCMKAGIDNENNSGISLWDSSVSFSEFSARETYADEAERDKAEADFDHIKQTADYPKHRFTMEDLDMDQKNLDFILVRAEEKRRAQSAPTSRDREQTNLIHM